MPESVWKLLHEEQPSEDDDCYCGFKSRGGGIRLGSGEWVAGAGDWIGGEQLDKAGNFGAFLPIELPIDIYWCLRSAFKTRAEAKRSLEALLCDRP